MSLSRTLFEKFANPRAKGYIGARFREKRFALFLSLLEDTFKERGEVNIIDIGGTRTYWNMLPEHLLQDMKMHLTIVNIPGMPLPEDDAHFSYVSADGCDLALFEDKSFDIAHSNSVLEHVGDWNRMVQFAKETSRLGKRYFVQTPNFWFPIEPHCMTPFFHWFPRPLRAWLLMHFTLGHFPRQAHIGDAIGVVDSARLVNKKMFRELFSDAEISGERILFLTKSHIAIRR